MSGVKEENVLELLDIYMDLVEKQDEVIYRLSKIVEKQATDLHHYKNIYNYFDEEFEQECKIAEEVLDEYEEMKTAQ